MAHRSLIRLALCLAVIVPLHASPAHAQDRDAGTITVQVRPAGADILIDGERWTGPADNQPLAVRVTRGRHRVEILKPGYQRFVTDMTVRAGETVPINVSLAPAGSRQPQGFAPPPVQQRPVHLVSRDDSGFMIAPDYKVSRIDGGNIGLTGVYGGRVLAGNVMLGAGGYWSTNGPAGLDMAYGGLVIEGREGVDRVVGFSVRALVGGGSTRQTFSFATTDSHGNFRDVASVRIRENFLVTEPEADVVLMIAPQIHIRFGVGYRFVGMDNRDTNRLSGATGSVSLQIGK